MPGRSRQGRVVRTWHGRAVERVGVVTTRTSGAIEVGKVYPESGHDRMGSAVRASARRTDGDWLAPKANVGGVKKQKGDKKGSRERERVKV